MKKIVIASIASLALLTGCDKAAKNGDTVVINFDGFLNGEPFAGGSAEGFPLKLGSGQFVPGFEEQLVGAKKGDTRDVKITFPENYVPGLSGKDVVFKVKIVDVK